MAGPAYAAVSGFHLATAPLSFDDRAARAYALTESGGRREELAKSGGGRRAACRTSVRGRGHRRNSFDELSAAQLLVPAPHRRRSPVHRRPGRIRGESRPRREACRGDAERLAQALEALEDVREARRVRGRADSGSRLGRGGDEAGQG